MADGQENQEDVQQKKSPSMEETQGQNLDSEHEESSDQRRETEPENRENGVSGLRANGNGHIRHHDSRERRQGQESRSMRETRPIRDSRDRDPRQRREAQEMQPAWGSSIRNASDEVLTSQRPHLRWHRSYARAAVDDIDPEFLATLPPDTQNHIRWAQSIQRGEPVHMDDASMIATQEDCDRMFAEALSKQFQEEDLASQRPHLGRHQSYVPPAVEEDDASMIATQDENDYDGIFPVDDIDPEYLAALPPDIQEEVLRAQRIQRRENTIVPTCQQALPEPNAIDPTFLEALPEDLRAEVFASLQPHTYVPPPDDYIPPKGLGRELIREQGDEDDASTEEKNYVDPTVLEKLPYHLRQKVYLDYSEESLGALPPRLLTEARMCIDQEMNRQLALQKQRRRSDTDWQRRGQEQRQRDIEKMKELRLKAKTVLDSRERARLEDIICRLSDEIVEGAKLAKSVSDSTRLRELGFITKQIVARFREERKLNKTLNAQENPVDIEMQRREAEDQELEEILAQSKRDYDEEQRQKEIERQRKRKDRI